MTIIIFHAFFRYFYSSLSSSLTSRSLSWSFNLFFGCSKWAWRTWHLYSVRWLIFWKWENLLAIVFCGSTKDVIEIEIRNIWHNFTARFCGQPKFEIWNLSRIHGNMSTTKLLLLQRKIFSTFFLIIFKMSSESWKEFLMRFFFYQKK